MLIVKIPFPVKFICGFIYKEEEIFFRTRKILEKKFGKIDFESQTLNFNFTHYYDKELGSPLFRKFISFKRLKNPKDFVYIKLYCIKIEKNFSQNNKRTINIDPGYLTESKLVLTTTKDFYHRIYLDKGIYAEVTLYYKNGNFQDFITTYPDYRTNQYKGIFLNIRKIYQEQIKNIKK